MTMPHREQLAIYGASDNQMHFTSMEWGLITFFPTNDHLGKKDCKHCLLAATPDECKIAPCTALERLDGQSGYFSIHDMPTEKNKEK